MGTSLVQICILVFLTIATTKLAQDAFLGPQEDEE